ncbi:MAG TPA: NAD(P)/FAD-dependent oxidoreductase [Solirubrobacteraceae bacterium]|nr:NAD(P)/FAD-dependent oxidoreductase [Solirubrobacteraceae bacterium]
MTGTDEPQASATYDVVVLGGGPPGENAAQYAIQGSDRSAVIVEAELVGGECSYWACMPSKALLRPVELHAAARAMPGLAAVPPLDVAEVLARRDAFTHGRDDAGQISWAEGAGIHVLRGRGRFSGPRRVEVTGTDGAVTWLEARHAVVLATGTSAAIPPVPGLAEALPWTSRDATNLTEIPRRIAIIGGGVVACEAATWLRGLGADAVTLLVRDDALLAGREPFVSELLLQRFTEVGIDVHLDANVDRVSRPGVSDTGIGHIHGGPVTLELGEHTLEVDEIIVAAGRRPNSVDLGLEALGIDTSAARGYVEVDDHLTVPGQGDWLYAVGDLNGRALLTHMGKYQARIAGAVIAARAEDRPVGGAHHTDRADHVAVPGVIFTDPQVAHVGMSEAQARARGISVETLEYDLAALAGTSLLRDDYLGRAKLVIDAARNTLVGATFVGADVGELLHSATVAIVGKVSLDDLWHCVPSYPTVAEIWLRLLEQRPPRAWQ